MAGDFETPAPAKLGDPADKKPDAMHEDVCASIDAAADAAIALVRDAIRTGDAQS